MRWCVVAGMLVLTAPAGTVRGDAPASIARLAWLQGCWQSTSPQRTIDEQWMAPRGGAMLGMARTVRGDAMVEYEVVVLREQDGQLVYHAHPSGQPSAVFPVRELTDGSVLFENARHDFPQRVGYRREGPDALLAWIEGTRDGHPRKVEFAYHRVPCP
jgi:hypothetical protein